jgi:hypothetical protein
MLEQDFVDEVLALDVGRELDVVGELFVDVQRLAESAAKFFPRGLRGGNGGVNHLGED